MMDKIYVTGGIGDIFVIESHFSSPPKEIHWASRARPDLQPLFEIAYPETRHIDLWSNLDDEAQRYAHSRDIPRTRCPDDVEDMTVTTAFVFVKLAGLYRGSRFLKTSVGDLEGVELPDRYVVCQHDTPYNSDSDHRAMHAQEWAWLKRATDLPIVVVGCKGSRPVPDDPRVIDRTGLSLGQSIEVLKGASGYYGIDSCLSVLAAQLFPADRLAIKGGTRWVVQAKDVYFKPHKEFPFLHKMIGEPVYNSMMNLSNVPMTEVYVIKEAHWLNTYPVGWIGEIPTSRAKEWFQYGLAVPASDRQHVDEYKRELEVEYVKAVKAKRKRSTKDKEAE